MTFCWHSNASSEYSGLLRTSIGVPAESQIQELFCSSVKFDHKISISECFIDGSSLLSSLFHNALMTTYLMAICSISLRGVTKGKNKKFYI